MAVMTEAVQELIPLQRDRRAATATVAVLRISSDSPLAVQRPVPARPTDVARIAPLLPIHRDRRSRQAAPVRRLTRLGVAMGTSALLWLAIVAGVLALGHTL